MTQAHIPDIGAEQDVLAAAIAYGNAAIYLVPVVAGSKNPGSVLGRDWPRKSSRDVEVLIDWLVGADRGIAIHAGRSGLVVFDVDNPDKLPEVLAKAIKECAPPFQATRPDTPRRGHYLFAAPAGRTFGNGTGRLGGGWGEVRGRNGVIMAAPSTHPDGGAYRWEQAGPIPVLPDEVAELLGEATESADVATDAEVLAFLAAHTATERPELLDGWLTTFKGKVADGESRHQRMVSIAAGAFAEARAGFFGARAAMEKLEAAFVEAVTADPVVGNQQGSARGPGMAASEWMGISAWAIAQAQAADLDQVRARVQARMPDADDLSWIPAPPAAAPGGGTDAGGKPRPGIDITHEADAICGIVTLIRHDRVLPGLYVREGRLVTVEAITQATGGVRVLVDEVGEDRLRRLLADHTDCYRVARVGSTYVHVPALPGLATCRAVLNDTGWGRVRPLAGVVHTPVLRGDGTVLQQPGYDAATGLYLTGEVGMPLVPAEPSAGDVAAATRLVLDQVLVDFPWVDAADRANFCALLFTSLLRPYTGGLAPLGAITAPERGTGKSLLAEIVMAAFGGAMRTMTDSDEEMRKAITATLRGTEPVVVFDNVPARMRIESPSLAQVLTARRWTDRLLGSSSNVDLVNDRLWLATGTNVKLGGDFAQRTVLVRIDPRQPRPDRRDGFAIDPLDEWVTANRGRLLHALMVLARAWIAAGAPKAAGLRMRSYSTWASAVGGLLAFCGIDGFLGNRDEVDLADEDAEIWSAFLAAWHHRYGTADQKVSSLRADAVSLAPHSEWSETFPRGRDDLPVTTKALSAMLRERRGRFYGGHRLEGRLDSHSKTWLWTVTTHHDADHAGHPQQPAGHPAHPQNGDDQRRRGSCGSNGSSGEPGRSSRETINPNGHQSPATPASPAQQQHLKGKEEEFEGRKAEGFEETGEACPGCGSGTDTTWHEVRCLEQAP